MGPTFRTSMDWLHTWAGLVLGSVLFAIFWMGTLSVFDREIDRWMMPDTRIAASGPISLDKFAVPVAGEVAPGVSWNFMLPTERVPAISFYYQDAAKNYHTRLIAARDQGVIEDQGTHAGTGFIFPFHFMLHIKAYDVGYWIVGLAAMAMLALLVSGVIIHRRIFADFFMLRVSKTQRTTLDLHNVTGVLGLPFHFVIALSGLVIFFSIYFPTVRQVAYEGDRAAFNKDAFGNLSRDAAGKHAGLGSLDAMVREAELIWGEPGTRRVRVDHPGDSNAVVKVERSFERSVTMRLDAVYFDGVTGQRIGVFEASPVMTGQRFISGLHFIQFRHWTLRWIYFVLGVSGCVMIATGFLFWLESRRKRHAEEGRSGVRVVEGMTIGSVTGIVIATLAFFIANRMLPLGASFAGIERAALEMWAFYLVWIATFAHAWARPGKAWREQCTVIAAGSFLAVVLNWLTTGDHLLQSLAMRHLWPVAGMDLLLLAGGAIALLTARRLKARADLRISARRLAPAE